ncbi:unnamed protein product [Cochlearia groenlandica]
MNENVHHKITKGTLPLQPLKVTKILDGQNCNAMEFNAFKKEIHAKVVSSYNDLNAKFDFVTFHLKVLDNQVGQITSTSNIPMGDQIEDNAKQGEDVDFLDEKEDMVVDDIVVENEVVKEKGDNETTPNEEKGKTSVEKKTEKPKEPCFVTSPYAPKLLFQVESRSNSCRNTKLNLKSK